MPNSLETATFGGNQCLGSQVWNAPFHRNLPRNHALVTILQRLSSVDTTLDTLPLDSNSASKADSGAVGGFRGGGGVWVLVRQCSGSNAWFCGGGSRQRQQVQWGFVSSFFMGSGAWAGGVWYAWYAWYSPKGSSTKRTIFQPWYV